MAKSGIHIKPENKGKFNALKKRTGKSTEQLTHSNNPLTRKRAVFAQNAKHWSHGQMGINLPSIDTRKLAEQAGGVKSDPEGLNLNAANEIQLTAQDISSHIPMPNRGPKPMNWGNAALTGLLAVDALLPPEESPYPVVRPGMSYNEHPYGTGSQAIAKDGITLSTTGYKSNSKDKNKKQLRIPSNQITMKDVPHPVLGIDSMGNVQYMTPGNDYQFQGEYVDEFPMAQQGGTFQTLEDINSANALGRRLSVGHADRNNVRVASKIGDPIPLFTGDVSSVPTRPKAFSLPSGVSPEDVRQDNGARYFDDPITGNLTYLDDSFGSDPKYRRNGDRQSGRAPLTDLNIQNPNLGAGTTRPVPNPNPFLASQLNTQGDQPDLVAKRMRKGGSIPQAKDGMTIIDESTVKFTGDKHSDPSGGIPISYGGKGVMVEGDETGYISPVDDSLTIMGNMKNPLTGRKFKSDSKILADKEAKMNELLGEGFELIDNNKPMDKWGSLKFNSGKIMMEGAAQKKKELTTSKEHLKAIQQAMLDISYETGVQPEKLGNAEYGAVIAQDGATIEARRSRSRKVVRPQENATDSERFNYLENKGLKNNHILSSKDIQEYEDLRAKLNAGSYIFWNADTERFNELRNKGNMHGNLTPKEIEEYKKLAPTMPRSYIAKTPKQVEESTSPQKQQDNYVSPRRKRGSESDITPIQTDDDGQNAYTSPRSKRETKPNTTMAFPAIPPEGEKKLSLAQRHNNPGNIMFGNFAKKYGAISGEGRSDKQPGTFAKFPDVQTGLKAMQDLITGPAYSNLTVEQATKKWTGESSYKNIPANLRGVKIKDIPQDQLSTLFNTITLGEDSRKYNAIGTTPGGGYTPIDPYAPPDIPEWRDINTPPPEARTKTPPPDYGFNFTNPTPRPAPSPDEPLGLTQILPELYGAATNRVEPVFMQKYQPELYEPYQVSFQDRLNENQASFSAVSKAAAYNPSALATLAGQKYSADSRDLADEFRTNQGIANDITNKNIQLLNDAEYKNLGLADTQYVRQSTAKSNTKAINHQVLNSISSKILQNERDNNLRQVYENLYDFRFDKRNNMKVDYVGAPGSEYINWEGDADMNNGLAPDQSMKQNYNKNGQLTSSSVMTPSMTKQQLDAYNLRNKTSYRPDVKKSLKTSLSKYLQDNWRK